MESKEKIFKKLSIVGVVKVRDWSIVVYLVDCIKNDPMVKIIKKAWDEDHKNKEPKYWPLDLSVINTWSTFENCADLRFLINDDHKLQCNARIFDGDSFSGKAIGLRFTAELILPDDFILKLEGWINSYLDRYLDNQYDDHLELKRKMWIMNKREKLLADKK